MDEDPETFQHPQSGDAGKPQDYSQQAPGFSGESQSRAGLDIHHELVIYCFNYLCGGVRERVASCGSSTFLACVTQSHGCQISNV